MAARAFITGLRGTAIARMNTRSYATPRHLASGRGRERAVRRSASKFALARFLIAFCIGVAATLAWQSYGDGMAGTPTPSGGRGTEGPKGAGATRGL